MSTLHSEDTLLLSALDALAASAAGTDAARERMMVALGLSRAAAADAAVLCLDRDAAPEAYSFEEAREAAENASKQAKFRRPGRDLLAAGLEPSQEEPSEEK